MAISVAQARQICTQAELDLVLQSTTRQIGSLDAKQLRSAIRRARTLRDKWRDRSESQTRDTKSQDPDKLGQANARSSDKAQLFDEALGRFEKRLSKVDGTTNGSAGAAKAKPAKPARTGEHRATRSSVRSTLSEKAGEINADSAAQPASSAATASAQTADAAGDASAKPAGKRTVAKKGATQKSGAKRKGPPKRKAPPRTSSVSPPAAPAPVAPGLAAAAMAAGRDGAEGSDQTTAGAKKRNLKAKTTAKATAVKPSGSPRMPGKVASQGRRSQAKRGSR